MITRILRSWLEALFTGGDVRLKIMMGWGDGSIDFVYVKDRKQLKKTVEYCYRLQREGKFRFEKLSRTCLNTNYIVSKQLHNMIVYYAFSVPDKVMRDMPMF